MSASQSLTSTCNLFLPQPILPIQGSKEERQDLLPKMSKLDEPRRAAAAAAAGPPAGNMPFIVSSNCDKADPATRKLIRSHVMRGKKKKRKSKRYAPKGTDVIGIGTSNDLIQRDRVNLEAVLEMYTPLIPGRFGTRLCFADLPDEIDPSVIMQMIQVSTVAIKIISPLLASIGFHRESGTAAAAPYLAFDAAALHINAYAVESFIDRILRRRRPEEAINPTATLHHQRGLQLLRQKLLGDDEEEKISDATVSVVLKLATAAHFDGDVAASRHHMQGLRKMVDLRGGIHSFNYNPKMRAEMLRCDLGIALLTDSKPMFFLQPSEPIPEYPEQLIIKSVTGPCLSQDEKIGSTLNEDLARVWRTTRAFCLLANLGTQTRMLLPPEIIHGTMAAVMYRLFYMSFVADSLDETMRLGLLVFTHHIFLQWQDTRPFPHGFSAAYRQSLRHHMSTGNSLPSDTMVWLLMIGAVSLFSISEEGWLRDSLREHFDTCQVKAWKDLQEILKSHL
ncbi:hypothetical protein PG994_003791 [Apiospora phragmitis]|uniref:Uncharacterized protein n=1 Tax=Apiospora phragmitis TaxID=2905665 RepID=A0ABR1W2Y3_9PEZI